MNSEQVQWSEEKQRRLEEHLVGRWAEDVWVFNPPNAPKRDRRQCFRFELVSPSLKIEIKYALWRKFDSGRWKAENGRRTYRAALGCLFAWFNEFSPPVRSLMERGLEQWQESLRSYLVQTGRFKPHKSKTLSAAQEYVHYVGDDPRIHLLGQIYSVIQDAYDDRPEPEKDVWDMHSLGLAVNLTGTHHLLNFTLISQPWLRQLAKLFMKYNMALHSSGDCYEKLQYLRGLSQFLEKYYPGSGLSDINRATMIHYMSFLQECNVTDRWRISVLANLRVFFETCTHELGVEGMAQEQLIVERDYPKDKLRLPREIPEDVLGQLRKNLETLDTTTLRMVVILLECGMRISELCALPLDCLINDDRHEWYLRSFQRKSKREHIIPLVNKTVIGAIQAQQQDVRERWGSTCRYLFPSIESYASPFKAPVFANKLNEWALEKVIRDSSGKLYRFKTHQFRHTVGMRLINDDIPLDIVSRLLGHESLRSTQGYARVRDQKVREELERVARKHKTINSQGETVTGGCQTNGHDAKLVAQDIRGQTLPVGGCGRPIVSGDCQHANKCVTCPFWLTSTEDLHTLKAFYSKAIRLRQRGIESRNRFVVENQDRIIPKLALRIARLEDNRIDSSLSVEDLLAQLRAAVLGTESGLEETRESGRFVAAKQMERIIADLKAEIAALEESL